MFQELKGTHSNPPSYLVAQMAQKQIQGVPLQAQCLISFHVNTGGHLLPRAHRKIPLFATHPSSYCPREDMPGMDEFLNLLLLESLGMTELVLAQAPCIPNATFPRHTHCRLSSISNPGPLCSL